MGKLVEDLHAIASQPVYQIADLAAAYGIKAEDLWADYIGLMAANTELVKYVTVKGPDPTPKV